MRAALAARSAGGPVTCAAPGGRRGRRGGGEPGPPDLAGEREHVLAALPGTRSLVSLMVRMNRDNTRSPARSVTNQAFHRPTKGWACTRRRGGERTERMDSTAPRPPVRRPAWSQTRRDDSATGRTKHRLTDLVQTLRRRHRTGQWSRAARVTRLIARGYTDDCRPPTAYRLPPQGGPPTAAGRRDGRVRRARHQGQTRSDTRPHSPPGPPQPPCETATVRHAGRLGDDWRRHPRAARLEDAALVET